MSHPPGIDTPGVAGASSTGHDPVVIVGCGLAGWTVARELRQRDKARPITMVCADNGHFYAKPMLSNALAQKKAAGHLIQKTAVQQAEALGVEVLANTRVGAIDRAARRLDMAAGAGHGAPLYYGKLVLALGADAIRLPTPGLEHAHSVNDIDDYHGFRDALAAAGSAARVAIIGGGLIGSEFANDLAIGGYQVSVVDPAPWLIGNLVSQDNGEALKAALAGMGVDCYLGDLAESVERNAAGGYRIRLRSGTVLEADLILSAVGLRPRVELAQQAGLDVARGILVDEMGRTSDPDIYALGDCAAYASAARADIADGAPRALPYIMPIMTAGKAIAATLAGQPTPIKFGPMPVRVKTPALPLTITG
jgi:rubredoxin-NAD+ reductase